MRHCDFFIICAVVALMFAACGHSGGSTSYMSEPPVMVSPPARVPDTLEEMFYEANSRSTDGSTVISTTRIMPLPETLPTEGISFSTPDRFSISFTLRVSVTDTPYAFESLNDLPVEFRDIHFIAGDGTITYEVLMALEYNDLDGVFRELYTMGVVEEYTVTVWDMGGDDVADDIDWWQARWDENNTIALTIVEAE